MKYMLLMQGTNQDVTSVMKWDKADLKRHIDFMRVVGTELFKPGELVTAEGLATPDQARQVRAGDNGEAIVTDGPFSETKEFLAGFWLIDVTDEARAHEIAAHISTAPGPGGTPLNFPLIVHPIGEAPA